jgi:hypothetical protein
MMLEIISPQQRNRVHPQAKDNENTHSKGQSCNENQYHKLAKEDW